MRKPNLYFSVYGSRMTKPFPSKEANKRCTVLLCKETLFVISINPKSVESVKHNKISRARSTARTVTFCSSICLILSFSFHHMKLSYKQYNLSHFEWQREISTHNPCLFLNSL